MEWDNKNINNMILYINSELNKGRTQKDIETNDFGLNERVIAKKLNRRGYKKINNQWIIDNNKIVKAPVEEKMSNSLKQYDNDNTIVIHDIDIKNKLLDLASNYDKIINFINEYENMSYSEYDKEYDGIEIKLPVETIKDFRTSIRINNVVWQQFNDFTESHKEYTKRDLLSMALNEYMNNHK